MAKMLFSVKKPSKEPRPPVERLAVGVQEASAMLGVSPRKIHEMTRNGELPSKKIGRRRVYSVEMLRRYVNGE